MIFMMLSKALAVVAKLSQVQCLSAGEGVVFHANEATLITLSPPLISLKPEVTELSSGTTGKLLPYHWEIMSSNTGDATAIRSWDL